MSAMASQITSHTTVYSTIYSGEDQRKYQTSASVAFVRGIHRWPVNSPQKGPVTRKMFPFDDVINVTEMWNHWWLPVWQYWYVIYCIAGHYEVVFFVSMLTLSPIQTRNLQQLVCLRKTDFQFAKIIVNKQLNMCHGMFSILRHHIDDISQDCGISIVYTFDIPRSSSQPSISSPALAEKIYKLSQKPNSDVIYMPYPSLR